MGDYRLPPEVARDVGDLKRRIGVLERNAELNANRSAAWQTPTLQNGFTNFGNPYTSAAYYKDTFGRVYLRGIVVNPVSDTGARPTTIFTLPTAYRPIGTHQFVVTITFADALANMVIEISPSGAVALTQGGPAGAGIPIDNLQFRTL